MNIYCSSAFNQMNVAVKSIIGIINTLQDDDLLQRPTESKHSIRELLEHTAMICKADALISDGSSQEEMSSFYSNTSYTTLREIKEALNTNYESLKDKYSLFSDDELQEEITSYWGVTYTRYEWLLEMVSHIYHHRGQLHAMLVHCCGKDPEIQLFE